MCHMQGGKEPQNFQVGHCEKSQNWVWLGAHADPRAYCQLLTPTSLGQTIWNLYVSHNEISQN